MLRVIPLSNFKHAISTGPGPPCLANGAAVLTFFGTMSAKWSVRAHVVQSKPLRPVQVKASSGTTKP